VQSALLPFWSLSELTISINTHCPELGLLTRAPGRGWMSPYLGRAGLGPGDGTLLGSHSGDHLGCSHTAGCSDIHPTAPGIHLHLKRCGAWSGAGLIQTPPPGMYHSSPLLPHLGLIPSPTVVPPGCTPALKPPPHATGCRSTKLQVQRKEGV
jgi:hypothetical protein